MKRFQFLLLDTGPIIKLFELDLWDQFIDKCHVTVSRTVANQAQYASQELEDVRVDLQPYEDNGLISIFDSEPSTVRTFYEQFSQLYRAIIHSGEKEMLAFLCNSTGNWIVCSADGAVFRVLGLLGKAQRGISLEEILKEVGLSQTALEWKYTKVFREKYTRLGQIDSVRDTGLI
jgi:hypothetical protein